MTKQLYLLWVNSAVKDVFGWELSDKNEKEFREAFYWINYKGIKTYIKLPLKRDFNPRHRKYCKKYYKYQKYQQ